jgi:TfoX/Sxy family transcriptional regulator of competence genes
MQIPKPDPKAKKALDALVENVPGVVVKPMFGNFSAFKNGTMFAGMYGEAVFVRLSEADRAAALEQPGAKIFEVMKGRPMKEYVCLPASVLADKKKAGALVARSVKYADSLPPKKAGAKARAKK